MKTLLILSLSLFSLFSFADSSQCPRISGHFFEAKCPPSFQTIKSQIFEQAFSQEDQTYCHALGIQNLEFNARGTLISQSSMLWFPVGIDQPIVYNQNSTTDFMLENHYDKTSLYSIYSERNHSTGISKLQRYEVIQFLENGNLQISETTDKETTSTTWYNLKNCR